MPFGTSQMPTSNAKLSVECAWRIVDDLYLQTVQASIAIDPLQIESELLFCLLGGFGITYEHGRSATEVILQIRPFSEKWEDQDLFEAVSDALMQPQFGPAKADGNLRRFRFPVRKASIIVRARRWLRGNNPLYHRLLVIGNCRERRTFLCDCPGIGLKTASWLLRNLGLGAELATIDIHVLRALIEAGRVPANIQMPRDYELVEDAFLEWCRELDASPAAFDLFVWHWQRGALVNYP